LVKRTLINGLIVVSLVGCQSVPNMDGTQGSGTIAGAATGSYISQMMGGNNLAGGAAGAIVGFNLIRMFANKRDYAIKAFQYAAEHNTKGVTTNWHNPHNWTYGSYTPIDTIQRPDGVYCRRISETVRMNHRLYQNMVQTCRVGPIDQRWVVVTGDMSSLQGPEPDSKRKSIIRHALDVDLSEFIKQECVFYSCNAVQSCVADHDTGEELLRLYKEALIETEGDFEYSKTYIHKKMKERETWIPFGKSTKFSNIDRCEGKIVEVVQGVL
jgi:surface antigen